MAMNNPTEARALFNEIKHNHFKSTTITYTDGSLNKSTERTTFAVTITNLDIEEATTLSRNSSVYTAEAEAINRAMELIYHLDDQFEELKIFSDSRSVIQSIESQKKKKKKKTPHHKSPNSTYVGSQAT
jgi:ribonuclease HI